MTRHTDKAVAEKARPVKPHFTVTAAAKQLAVTREHLSRVLHGHRQSRSLSRRYAELKRAA